MIYWRNKPLAFWRGYFWERFLNKIRWRDYPSPAPDWYAWIWRK